MERLENVIIKPTSATRVIRIDRYFFNHLKLNDVLLAIQRSKTKLNSVAFGPRANYADRATAASWRISANFYG
jgi:hypothetical protein